MTVARSHVAGRSVLLFALVLTLAVAALPPAARADHVADHNYMSVIDITFPTDPDVVYFSDTYDACRSGCARNHKAVDIIGPKMTPLYAAVAGRICGINDGVEDGYGRHITLCGDDGREYRYLHVNNDTPGTDDGLAALSDVYAVGIRNGVRVARGQHIAYMGDSGNAEATVSHLHWDVFDDTVTDPYGDGRINPYPSVRAALDRGDVADGSAVAATDPMHRIAGSDRVGTAVALTSQLLTASPTVAHLVLASAGNPQDAIVAGPLAAQLGGPVLVSWDDRIDPRLAAEITRLAPERVTIVGTAITEQVVAELIALGIPAGAIDRIAGENRWWTSILVAERVWELQDADVDGPHRRNAVVAVGQHPVPGREWPDSVMASYLGAVTGAPVLLVDATVLPDATLVALTGTDTITVIGGPGAVSEEIAGTLDAVSNRRLRRLAGATRYGTAVAVTDHLLRLGLVSDAHVYAATGHNWPDVVTAGPNAAASGVSLLLVDGSGAGGDAETQTWLRQRADRFTAVTAIGGQAAVSDRSLLATAMSIT